MLAEKSCLKNVKARTPQNDAKEKTTIFRLNVDYIYIRADISPRQGRIQLKVEGGAA